MKKLAVTLILFTYLSAYGQYNDHFLLASAGSHFSNESYHLSWSLGETLTETFSAGNYVLTQGFQQPSLEGVGIDLQQALADLQFEIYPNPTQGKFKLAENNPTTKEKLYQLKIFDIRGEVVLSKKDSKLPVELHIENHPDGVYFLKIVNGEADHLGTFRVHKLSD